MSVAQKSRTALSPSITISERNGRVANVSVSHHGVPSAVLDRFPMAVVRKAVDRLDFYRSRFEHSTIMAARKLDPTSQQIVYHHLLLPHCERILAKQQRAQIRQLQKPTLTQRAMKALAVTPAQPFGLDDRDRGR